MGMEGNPQEPLVPDESERIDDVDKARAMARAGNEDRSEAAKQRGYGYDNIAEIDDRSAERKEENIAVAYDTAKEAQDMNNDELEEAYKTASQEYNAVKNLTGGWTDERSKHEGEVTEKFYAFLREKNKREGKK